MKCKYCGKKFTPDAKHPHQKYCSIKCGRAHRDDLIARETYRKEVEAKTLADWVREARECNLDYGTIAACALWANHSTNSKLKPTFDAFPLTLTGVQNIMTIEETQS